MKSLRTIAFLAILGGLLGAVFIQPAAAQADRVSLRVTPAFDGYFKNGEWLTVWAEIENNGKNVEAQLSALISSSSSRATYAAAVSLPSGARKRVPLYILANNYSRELEIQLTGPEGLLAKQKVTVRPQANLNFLTGLVARERGGLALLNGISLPGQERPKVIVDASLEDLPERVEGLRSLDLLVLNDVDTSRLTPGQQTALADWVRQGGRLVLGGGLGAAAALAGLPEDLLPATLNGQSELAASDLSGLADFARGTPIQASGTFIASKINLPAGSSLLAGSANQPLAVESRYGEGRVDFIALDLSSAPFDSWPGTIRFWNQLLAPTGEYPQDLPADISLRQMYGMEMVGNLSNIPALDLPSIQWLSLLIGIYILLVGPVNYLVLRRLRKLQLAWFTIPGLTLLFSAGAFGIGTLLHGTDVILNQIAMISPNGNGAAAVTNYLGLFSPSQQSYSVEVKTPGLVSAVIGSDGNSWGPGGPLTNAANVTFLQGETPRVTGLAIDQWSFQAFSEEERWSQFGNIRGDLRLDNDKIVGTLRNETGAPLTDLVVVAGANFVRLGDLAAGAEKQVELDMTINAVNNRNGMPMSYRIYEPSNGMNRIENTRMNDLKRSLVSRVLDGANSKFAALRSATFSTRAGGQSSGELAATLIAWTDRVPPDVTVNGAAVKKQVVGMVTQKFPLQFGGADLITIPMGMIPGSISKTPTSGGTCGGSGVTGVLIESGSAEFTYQLPDLGDYRVQELRLSLSADGPATEKPDIALYDPGVKSWTTIKDVQLGFNTIERPQTFIDANQTVQVRVSGGSSLKGFCTYIDLGLKAEKAAQSGGANVSR